MKMEIKVMIFGVISCSHYLRQREKQQFLLKNVLYCPNNALDCINQSIDPSFCCGTQGIHKIPPPFSVLGDALNLCPGLFYSFILFTVLHHVFFGLHLLRFPWGFHSSACLVISPIGFRSVRPSHPHLRLLICKSILGCLVHFHSSLFVIWSGQKTLSIFLKLLLIKTCSLVVIYFEFFQVSHPQSRTAFTFVLQLRSLKGTIIIPDLARLLPLSLVFVPISEHFVHHAVVLTANKHC